MIRPLENKFAACYYDGLAAVRHDAEVHLDSAGLTIEVAGIPAMLWHYQGMKLAADGSYGEPVRIERPSREALVVESHDFVEALRQHGFATSALQLDLRSWPAVLFCCIAIVAIGSAMYVWGMGWVADQAARLMPASMENRIGRAVVAILAPEETRCTDSARRLQPIVDRLRAATGSKQQFELIYVNQPLVNAFAAPGGYIIVFRGLLDQAETPQEFAGVLAHEMEHVLLRHSTRAIAREFSGRTLLSLMAVDSSGTPAAIQAGAKLASLSYQRSDEEAADLAGVALLTRAHIPTDGLTAFFRRMQKDPALQLLSVKYLSTHPDMSERIDSIEAQTKKTAGPPVPLMTIDEWKQARQVCGGK